MALFCNFRYMCNVNLEGKNANAKIVVKKCPEFGKICETCTNNDMFINESWDKFTEFIF